VEGWPTCPVDHGASAECTDSVRARIYRVTRGDSAAGCHVGNRHGWETISPTNSSPAEGSLGGCARGLAQPTGATAVMSAHSGLSGWSVNRWTCSATAGFGLCILTINNPREPRWMSFRQDGVRRRIASGG
jgi:hypothetical protein